MPGEFAKRVEKGRKIQTCIVYDEEFVTQTRPRGHVCTHEGSAPTTPRTKEKDKLEWSGPATLIGQKGKLIFLKYGNNLRRVHICRLIKVGEEYQLKNQHDDVKLYFRLKEKNQHEDEVVQQEDEDNIVSIDEETKDEQLSQPKDHKEKLQ